MRLVRYRFGAFVLDPAARELTRNGERIALPLKSLECVAYLLEHRQRAVGRDELVSAVWGRADVSDTVITQTLRRARKALDDAGDRQTVIRTVPGFGYRWVAEVEDVDAAVAELVHEREPEPEPECVPVLEPASAPVSAASEPRSHRWKLVWLLAGVLALGLMGLRGCRCSCAATRPPWRPCRPR